MSLTSHSLAVAAVSMTSEFRSGHITCSTVHYVTVCHINQYREVFHLAGRPAENKWQALAAAIKQSDTHAEPSHLLDIITLTS